MIPRTPTGDLIAALLLFAAALALIYISVHDGRLGTIERARHPLVFWGALSALGVFGTAVAALTAWEAVAALLGG